MAFNFVPLHFIIIQTPENTKIQVDLAVTELAFICLKLTIKTPSQCPRRSGVFIVNFEHI